MRKLATIRRIDVVTSIPKADRIELATIGGWKTVIKRGEFIPGDMAVYVEVDSWMPHDLAPWLSKGKEPRLYQGILGERLTTMELRGQISQGLAMPLSVLDGKDVSLKEGTDVTEVLGIVLWRREIPEDAKAHIKAHFPTLIQKTRQERIQNIPAEILAEYRVTPMAITEKVHGESTTFYLYQGNFGVCGHDVEYVDSPDVQQWVYAHHNKIKAKIRDVLGDGFALQGEWVGPGIQGNYYELSHHHFLLFDIYDINEGRYLDPDQCRVKAIVMGIDMVPKCPPFCGDFTPEAILEYADGFSEVPEMMARHGDKPVRKAREGVVFSARADARFTFKAISNKYLLKHQ